MENVINKYCPRSGKPVAADSLTEYADVIVGFCNPHCRDDFAANIDARPSDTRYFDAVIKERSTMAKPGNGSGEDRSQKDRTMIVEIRSYRIVPGRRAEFLDYFKAKAIPALRDHGMKVVGPFVDTENPNKFVWLRSFASIEERTRLKEVFYEGDLWKTEMESVVMPMLDSYDCVLCETAPGFVTEGLEEIV